MSRQLKNRFMLFTIAAIFVSAACAASIFFVPADYYDWRSDWAIFRQCVRAAERICSELSQFPMAYLLNSRFSGKSPKFLALINIGFYTLPILLAFILRGRVLGLKIAFLYAVAIIFSPIPLFYINTGALETQSGVLVGALMAITILAAEGRLSKPTVAFGFAFLSAILIPLYKDTLIVILGATFIGTLIILPFSKTPRLNLTHFQIFALIFGFACGVMIAIGYNFYRYNEFYPVPYLKFASVLTPGISKTIEYFVLSVFSPNGGVLIFWAFPIAITYIVLRAQGLVMSRVSVLVSGLMLFISCIIFARWWSPFGWDSWGNRLMFQPALSALIIVLLTSEQSAHKLNIRNARFAIPALIAIILSGPYTVLPYIKGPQASMYNSLWSEPACLQILKTMQTTKVELEFWKGPVFYECARQRMLFYMPLHMARSSLR